MAAAAPTVPDAAMASPSVPEQPPVAEGDVRTSEDPAQGAGPPPPDGPTSPTVTPSTGAPSPPPTTPPPARVAIDPDGPVGSACRQLLRAEIPALVVEVDTQDGATLPAGVLDHLTGTIAAVADTPGGIAVDTAGTVPGDRREWTLEDLRAAAAATRDHPQTPDQAVLHVLSVRGVPDPDDPAIAGAIGIAFAATEFVVFGDRVDGLAVLLGGGEAVLRAVVVHELGHLLCLVNLGYTSEQGREDPAHPGHSANTGSVMFHAIETTAVGQIFSGPPPDAFDAADLADLEALRTGRY